VFLYPGSVAESRDSTLSSLLLSRAACAHRACRSAVSVWKALAKLVVTLTSFFLKQNKNPKIIIIDN
jgi:hypothetical protein